MKKTILITGASSGIGRALALEYSKQSNTHIFLAARGVQQLEEVKLLCEKNGAQATVLELDLASRTSMDLAVKKLFELTPQLDVCVHNGGISQRSLVKETSFDVFEKLIQVNYLGTIYLTQALLPSMIKHKTGHFVVISSLMGKFGTSYRSGYAGAKHALQGFFDSLRAELQKEFNGALKVTVVCPGYVKTDVSLNALTKDGSQQGSTDRAQRTAMEPEIFAKKYMQKIDSGKPELVIAGKEVMALYLKRFCPSLFAKVVAKAQVT